MIFNNNEDVIHISHMDSDGYGAQYITSFIFNNIKYINVNYDDDIRDLILNSSNINKNPILIITDISMNDVQLLSLLDGIDKKFKYIYYIDHHQGEININNEKLAIFHDINKSSTEITYKNFIENNDSIEEETKNKLCFLSKLITVYDLNKVDDILFPQSTVLNDACMAEWCNPFPYNSPYNIDYRLLEIDISIKNILKNKNYYETMLELDTKRMEYIIHVMGGENNIKDIYDAIAFAHPKYNKQDNAMCFVEKIHIEETFLNYSVDIKKLFLVDIKNKINIYANNRREKVLDYFKESLRTNVNFFRKLQKEHIPNIDNNTDVVVFYKEKQMLFHAIAPDILKNNNVKVLCNILPNKRLSIRTSREVKAHLLTKELFNGGGHKNEAGGQYQGRSSKIKERIEKYLEKVSESTTST